MRHRLLISVGLIWLLGALGPAPAASGPPPRPAEVVVEVRIHGNHSTPDADVVRLAGVAPGDPLGPETVAAVETRLRDSGRFDEIEVRKRTRSLTATPDVVLIIVVRERPAPLSGNLAVRTGQLLARKSMFMPLLSYAEGYGFTYGVQASTIDLFGGGERLSIPMTWGGTKQIALEMEREFARGPASRIETRASFSSREHPHFEVDDTRVALTARVDRDLVEGLRLSATGGWTDTDFAELDDRFVTYGISLQVDTRQDPTFPRDAVFASVGWEGLDLIGPSDPISRTRLDGRVYKGVVGQSVLSIRALYEDADRTLPAYERALLGGSGTVRGYGFGDYIGDNLAVASAELRVPLTSPLEIGNAGVSLFYDTGAVYDVGRPITKTRFRQGAGAGLFLIATVFQLKLDVAYGFDDGVRMHFATGFAF